MSDNVRILIDMIEYLDMKPNKKVAFIFVYAGKVFDKVLWNFLKKILEQMEMGEQFTRGLKAIYEQEANLIINNNMTEFFKIEKGTRQGCPLSPLLFILVLEILNQDIRSDQEIKGISLGEKAYKLMAFADDLVLMVENPKESIANILEKMGGKMGKSQALHLTRRKKNG